MAWVTIPNSAFVAGAPILGSTGTALRDNLASAFAGNSGAPKLDAQALQTGSDEEAWVGDMTAGLAVGAVGTYAFLGRTGTGTVEEISVGEIESGANWKYAGMTARVIDFNSTISITLSTTSPSGTWVCCGFCATGSGEDGYIQATTFKRVT